MFWALYAQKISKLRPARELPGGTYGKTNVMKSGVGVWATNL